ncbi:MAG: hypothetical protein MJ233_05060 [Mycoplasmoidaceae bacterium]|nr:hypothetical protein [Mycoplasmoidaceae bacterium]
MLAEGGKIETLFAGNYALAISFMIFLLYYMPCIPSINTMRTEVGRKNM